MKRILISTTCIVFIICVFAALNYFFQQDFVNFFTEIGWGKAADFVSRSWWNSLPIFILAIGVLSSMWLTWWQVREARLSTNARLIIEISRELRGEDNINSLSYIYSLRLEHFKEGKIQVGKIEHVINRLSMLGVLVAKGIIYEELAIKSLAGTTSLRCWYQLHPYIKQTQTNRGYFGEDFEDFTRRSLDYFKDANIQVLFSIEGDTNKIDLVIKLQENDFLPRSKEEIERDRKIKPKTDHSKNQTTL